ncbi:MAG TPA: S41 family peptidase [Thermoanaerobaculia bacterium]|jgi:ketosteroid isomerase-like protein
MRLGIAALLLFACTAFGQETPIAAPVDANARKEIGAKIADALENMYVVPETGKTLAAKVRADFASGKYDASVTAPALAEAITKEFASANDRHLYVRYAAGAKPGPPPAPKNHGYRAVQRLEPNVGYIDVGMFVESADAQALTDAAMAFVRGTDAVIVDVRRCPGGSGQQVAYLASYFFGGSEPVVLANRYHRPSGRSMQSTTVDVKGQRMPDVPLYILTSPNTGSACESFAFSLQQHGRAKVVGATTGGGGYNNALIPLGHGLSFSVSVGSVSHPKTGKGWQGVGVQPDVVSTADRALDAARAAIGGPVPDVAAEVKKVEREWLDAYENRDAEAMKRIIADDFVIYFGNGNLQKKADIVRMMERGKAAGRPGGKFWTEESEARVYGDTVVLTGRVISQQGDSREVSRYTDTWVRRDGKWQVVSSHLGNEKTK